MADAGARPTWRRYAARNRNIAVGAAILAVVILAALLAGVLSTHDPRQPNPAQRPKPRTAMLIRSTVLSLRELDYVQAARALGRRDLAIAFRHILPNCVGPLLVQASFIFAYAILAEAILGFLGVGVPPYVPSWGNVIASGKNVIREAFWVSLFPGLALTVAGLSLNLLGDGLRDTLDPRLRGRS